MNCRTRLPVAAAAAVLLLGCLGDTVSPPTGGPSFAVSDGAHDGNPDFFFLPPLFPNPSAEDGVEAGAFNAQLSPVVQICRLGLPDLDGKRECVETINEFSGSAVQVSTTDQHYHVNWHTDESGLDPLEFYRITVSVGNVELGYADVDPVMTGKELKNLTTGEFIGLVDGRTLPIKFRAEHGVLCDEDGTPCTSATIDLTAGGGVQLVAQTDAGLETFRVDVPPNTTAEYNNEPVTELTLNLDVCNGIAIDLPTVGACLRVATFFEGGEPGSELTLSNPVLISMCSFESALPENQEALITLHQQDGDLIRALPHVDPEFCESDEPIPQSRVGLPLRGWRLLRDFASRLFVPATLHARTRTAVLNLGGGGETDRFGSSCDGAASAPFGMLLAECPPQVAPMAVAAAVAEDAKTISSFQFALPAMMEILEGDGQEAGVGELVEVAPAVYVSDLRGNAVAGATIRFVIDDGDGTLDLGSTVPCGSDAGLLCVETNSDGIARVASWTLGVAGANAVKASGKGLAVAGDDRDGPRATFDPFIPFTPAIDGQLGEGSCEATVTAEACLDAQVLGRGDVTFTATAVAAAEGLWAPTGSLPAGRRDHTATLLTNGDVLIVGGTASGAFIYNTDAGSFTATEGEPIYSHGQHATATRLLDGRVLIVGGLGAPFGAEIYNPSNGSFTATAGGATEGNTNASRVAHSATLLPDGRVLLVGGQFDVACNPDDPEQPCGPQTHAEAEIYDPADDSFAPVGSLADDRSGHGAVLLPDGRVLIMGGTQTTQPGFGFCLATAELFEPDGETFTTTGSMTTGRCDLLWNNALLLTAQVLVTAGGGTTAELYDLAEGTFSATGSMASSHSAGSGTRLADGRVLVAGGVTAGGPVTSNAAEIYNPTTATFTPAASLSIPRQQHSATRLLDGRVLVVGGFSSPAEGDVASAEVFSLPAPIP